MFASSMKLNLQLLWGDIGLAVMIFVIQLFFLGDFCAFDYMNDLRWLLTLHAATGLR